MKMKTQTIIISAITIYTIAIAITAYAHGPSGDARGDYEMAKNNYAMMGGRGMMGGNESDSGMMHGYGHDDQNRYNRDTTDNYKKNRRGYMNDRDSSDHHRRRPEYDGNNRGKENHYRWNPENNRKNDLNPSGDFESFKNQSK